MCAYYVRIKTARIFCGNILYGILLVRMVFVWATVNIEVWLFVFLVSLVAQKAVRSTVNVSVKEGYFPGL